MLRIWGSALILCLAYGAPSFASVAKLVGARPTGDSHTTSWVIFNDRTRCNAVLISERILMTAGHCLGGIRSGDWASWTAKLSDARSANTIRIRRTFLFPNPYPLPRNGDYRFYTQDVGFLELENAAPIEPLSIDLDRRANEDERASAISYGGAAAARTIGTMRLKRIQDDAWVYGRGSTSDVSGEPGDSGSAVLSNDGKLLGLISGGSNGETAVFRLKSTHLLWLSQHL